ncbi:D-alanyl-D-alanine carboxypeptidase/D-alanyl-D-alanine-endopeptidase (penicillin-binding protein 4) [Nocardioides daedukensis]|uniref:D-alanyl-D-alanine carboxypeptidase/D-alanyl-D-alanine-endopeptidase (Penicillin-binding protein 4) n=1 Tax=Nocardioides daedukensis TaxID=634462 RepID=A0A7Y9S3W0_9ACTN|nr:D-alanyl-D-alanine carboxypeptidase/D-alanyl-D-alanine-endopeptidase (penicillin-binding protein 4) [Nocardioides daedukensis]
MAGSRRDGRKRPPPSRSAAWLPVGVVLVVLAAAFASFEYDLAVELGWAEPGTASPASIEPPEGLDLPELSDPDAVAAPAGASGTVSAAKVRSAISKYTTASAFGPRRTLAIGGVDGTVHYESRHAETIPASTMKILTGAAALEALGSARTFDTTVRVGASADEIVLVGGGDPYLMRKAEKDAYPAQADLVTLAARTAASLKEAGTTTVKLGFDDSLFSGPRVSEDWPADYVTDAVVSPISALFIDQGAKEGGWGFETDPAKAAADAFKQELGKRGITVTGGARRTVAPSSTEVAPADEDVDSTQALTPGSELAVVHSAPVWQIVERVLAISDNEGAELLAHHVAIELGAEPSFEGGAIAVETTLQQLGVDITGDTILDASGLSRGNVLTASTLLDVLSVAASPEHPELRPVITGLPVAGFTGSLANRYAEAPQAGAGRVRAKTGTLTGVHGLAGVTTDLDGNVFTFVFVADRVKVEKTLDARAALVDLTAALASCHCSS